MTNRTIAVGIDFSEHSDAALEQASWLAKRKDAELLLVHVGAPALPGTGALLPSVRIWEKILEQRAVQENLQAKQLAKKIADQGVPATHYLVDGEPAERIVEFASDQRSEMIVVGTHGLTGAQSFLLGSVAQGVIRHARCNVWVARKSGTWDQGPIRILIGTDFSEFSAEALRVAIEIAPDDSTIDVVHSWQAPLPIGPAVPSPELATLSIDLEKNAKERGKKLVEEYATSRIHLEFKALAGPPASTLIAHAKEAPARYDLIVLGGHGRRGFRRFFLGSVAEKVVRHAPCSALVVHRQADIED